jgi:hypothetical protein
MLEKTILRLLPGGNVVAKWRAFLRGERCLRENALLECNICFLAFALSFHHFVVPLPPGGRLSRHFTLLFIE